VSRIGKKINVSNILMAIPEERRVFGRFGRRWEANVKVN
jgi:hypothetical protein